MWIKGQTLSVHSHAPDVSPTGIFFNSYTGNGPNMGVWTTRQLSGVVPDDTVAIHLTGTLIITHGQKAETADLRVYFRKDSLVVADGNYKHQCIEASAGNGQRSTMACWVPLTGGLTFDWKWEVPSLGAWPLRSAYGANLSIDAVLGLGS